MNLLESISIPSEWDALSAEPSLELLAKLQNLETSPLRDARLAYLFLMLGRIEDAKAIVQTTVFPLTQAVEMAIWVEQHRFQRVLSAPLQALDGLSQALGAETQARVLLEQSKAQFHLCQHREAWRLARQAEHLARGCKMESLALVCALHAEECHISFDETDLHLSDREADLREWVGAAPSQESRVMAYMALVRLLSRQGLYDKAMRFTLEVPKPLNGQYFVELMLVLNNLDDLSDWHKLYPRYQGRMHAVKGLLQVDADFVLAGPPPDSTFHPRPRSEWNLAFAWAHLSKGNYSEALEYLQATFVPRCEWDIRFIRDLALIELFILAPELMGEYHLEQLLHEALGLLQERISPQSLIIRLLPRVMPYATALLLTLPQIPAFVSESVSSQLLLATPKGLIISGVTHANTTALVKLLEGDTAQMSPSALRTNRHRLKLFLQQFNQPTVVRGSLLWSALQSLCSSAEDPQLWQEVSLRFAHQFSFAQ